MRRQFLIVHNPLAGIRKRWLLQKVVRELVRRGAIITQISTTTRRGMPANRRENIEYFRGFDTVVAVGGDGTVRALAPLASAAGVALGVVPTGTGNVLAHEIGLRPRPKEVAGVLLDGPLVEVTGGRANGEPFFLMAGAGFDGAVVGGLNRELKRYFGRVTYSLPLLATLRLPPQPFDVEVDGVLFPATWVVVSKVKHYASRFIIAPGADMLGADFVVTLFDARTRAQRLRELTALAAGKLGMLDSVCQLRAHHVEIGARCRSEHAVQLDGDTFSHTPVSISSDGAALQLIVPQTYAGQTTTSHHFAA